MMLICVGWRLANANEWYFLVIFYFEFWNPFQYNLIQQIIQADISDPLLLADIITRRPELGFLYIVPRQERNHVDYSLWSIKVVENVKAEAEHSTVSFLEMLWVQNSDIELIFRLDQMG